MALMETVNLKINGTSGAIELEKEVAYRLLEYFELWKYKQLNYGPGNISALGGPGVVMRMNDKYERLWNYYINGVQPDDDKEGERDAWLDMLGYGLIGLLLHDNVWPGQTERRFITPEAWELIKERYENQNFKETK